MAVYDKKKYLLSGDPNTWHDVLEHVVFQRMLLPNTKWVVYGKIQEKPLIEL